MNELSIESHKNVIYRGTLYCTHQYYASDYPTYASYTNNDHDTDNCPVIESLQNNDSMKKCCVLNCFGYLYNDRPNKKCSLHQYISCIFSMNSIIKCGNEITTKGEIYCEQHVIMSQDTNISKCKNLLCHSYQPSDETSIMFCRIHEYQRHELEYECKTLDGESIIFYTTLDKGYNFKTMTFGYI